MALNHIVPLHNKMKYSKQIYNISKMSKNYLFKNYYVKLINKYYV